MADSWIHGIRWVHLLPSFLCADGCFVFRAMAMFSWELATSIFDDLLDAFLGVLHVYVGGDHEAVMKDVTSKVGTQTSHLNAQVLLGKL
eukprot:Skav209901  [mRNA]  locus=scaffold2642:424473:424739:+ [translate_table: standard]